MTEVLEAVDRLRQAAGQQSVRRRDLRIGTVVTASASLLAPALRDLHARHGSGGVDGGIGHGGLPCGRGPA